MQRRAVRLVDYQDARYAARYEALVRKVAECEAGVMGAPGALTKAVATYYFKLLAYKDEYEVARLYTHPSFRRSLEEAFEGDFTIEFNMAPPFFQSRDPQTGRYKKRPLGPWALHLFRFLARCKRLRGTKFDLFGYATHRRIERQLIAEYEQTIGTLLGGLKPSSHGLAVEIAALPEEIRGYDTVKEESIRKAERKRQRLLTKFTELQIAN